MARVNHPKNDPRHMAIAIPYFIMLMLWAVAVWHWITYNDIIAVIFLGYIGLIAGVGIGGYIAMPDRQRPLGRKLIMILVGGLLLVVAIVSDHGNMQIEGLFFALLVGFAPYIVLHYLLAKLVGPLVFGRIWCGWACWYGMVFDLLPFPFSRFRYDEKWSRLRYVHFAISLLIVAALIFFVGYTDGALGVSGLYWFVGGLALYYVVGIALAFYLKDNRAFCKYLCPISVPLKAVSRFSLLKVSGTPDQCATCEACVEMCPMNIRVKDYIMNEQRVLSTECTLCQTCISVCPHDSLTLSFKFDVGGVEIMDYEPPNAT